MSPHKSNRSTTGALAFACAALALGGALGCEGELLTSEERATLDGLRLAPLPASPTNALADNADAAQLGQQFFFDRRFSGPLQEGSDPANGGLGAKGASGMVACATCHDPARGGADPRTQAGRQPGRGLDRAQQPHRASTPPTPAGSSGTDARTACGARRWRPLEHPLEQNTTRMEVARVIYEHYRQPYEALFGAMPDLDATRFPPDGRPGMAGFDAMSVEDKVAVNRVFANFGKAIEAYERLLVDKSSPFDRFMAGDHAGDEPRRHPRRQAVRGPGRLQRVPQRPDAGGRQVPQPRRAPDRGQGPLDRPGPGRGHQQAAG